MRKGPYWRHRNGLTNPWMKAGGHEMGLILGNKGRVSNDGRDFGVVVLGGGGSKGSKKAKVTRFREVLESALWIV